MRFFLNGVGMTLIIHILFIGVFGLIMQVKLLIRQFILTGSMIIRH